MKSHRRQLTIRIDADVARLLEQAAKRRNISLSVLAGTALHAYLAPEAGDDRESVVTANLERLSRQLQNTADKLDALQETMGLFVRIIGLARAAVKIGMANLAYNLRRLVWHQRRAAFG